MPRPRKHTPTVRREVMLPTPLSKAVDRLHYDPVLDRPTYGAFSQYVIGLIRKDLKEKNIPLE